MNNPTSDTNILYVNKYTNVYYTADDILELNLRKGKDEMIDNAIFNLYVRLLTKCEEQRLVFYHLTFDKEAYSIPKLIKFLCDKYGKSERTYRRAIEYLIRRRIIKYNNSILEISMDYNLPILDLHNIKGIMVHII